MKSLTQKNAEVLAELIIDPLTDDSVRVKAIQQLIESRKEDSFHSTMFMERVSLGKCPCCDHETHWLIPENELNKLGWVSHELDARVKANTTGEDCARFQEACGKKRINV